MSNLTSKSSDTSPVKIEAPKELPKVSLVNESLKKLKFHLARFDNVVKIRTTPDARTKGEWGFEHTKAVFNNEIIPFLKSLKDIFNVFDKDLLNEIMEVQIVFDQMDVAVQQSSVDKQCLEIAKKELLLENDRLLQQIMSQDVLLTVMNSMSLIGESVNMDRKRKESCDKCFNLEAELLKSQNAHNDLLKSYSQLEKHCISLELSIQLNQEIFQKDESCNNQNALEILEFFENNDLKAQLQDKDTTISVMSSASSAVTYTSVYTDSEPGRAFWGADDEEVSEGGIPRVIVYGYDGLPIQPVAPPSPDYIPGPEDPQTPPVPQDEDEREPMFAQAHDPDYVPEPVYPEYIPLEDEHVFPAEEQPLPPVDSPTAESPGYITESDPEEDPEEYEDDETEDGPVDYPMDGGDDGDDDDGDSSGDDADDEDEEDEEEEEHLAPADSTIVVPTDEPVSPPEGTEPAIPPPSTDITIGARITIRP
ncbi:hypothetical protein Tco_0447729 [Tanacetum coccineum]